jgi:hypothetical protein
VSVAHKVPGRHHTPELEDSPVPADTAEAALHIAEGEAQEVRYSPVLGDIAEVEGIAEAARHTVGEEVPGTLHRQLLLPPDTAGVEDIVGTGLAADTGPAADRDSEEGIDLGRGSGQLADRMEPHMGADLRMEAGRTLCVGVSDVR